MYAILLSIIFLLDTTWYCLSEKRFTCLSKDWILSYDDMYVNHRDWMKYIYIYYIYIWFWSYNIALSFFVLSLQVRIEQNIKCIANFPAILDINQYNKYCVLNALPLCCLLCTFYCLYYISNLQWACLYVFLHVLLANKVYLFHHCHFYCHCCCM